MSTISDNEENRPAIRRASRKALNVVSKWSRRWASLIVSICALAIAIQQGYETREFNRAALAPYFYVEFTHSSNELGWTVENNGSGPALLAWLKVSVDGKNQKSWEEFNKSLGLPETFGHEWKTPSSGKSLTVIGPGKSFLLYRAWTEDQKHADSERLLKLAGEVRLEGCICSVYWECWRFTSGGKDGVTEVEPSHCHPG
jgi:hypothetical protein